jgi:hypothetical protein
MVWTQTHIDALLVVAKGASANVGDSVARQLALGQWVSDAMYDMYTLENCIHSLQTGGPILEDDDYNVISEIIDKIAMTCPGAPASVGLPYSTAVYTPTQLPSYVSTSLPSPAPAGQMIYVSDLGTVAYSNGTLWIT